MKRLFVGGPLHGELRELSADERVIQALEADDSRYAILYADSSGSFVTYYRTAVVVTRNPGGFARRGGTRRVAHLFTPGGKEPEAWELADAMMIAFRVELGVEEHSG